MTSLPEFSTRKPVTVTMILICIIVFGTVAYLKLPLKMLPDGFVAPFMHIRVPYPTSTPDEVMNQIALPIEDALSTVSNLKELNSNSTSGGAFFWMEFNQDTDMATAYQEVSDRIERTRPDLPEDVDKIFIRRWNPNDEEIISLGITPPKEADDATYVLKNLLEPRLQRVEGVAKVEFYGLDEKEIIIEADIDKIKQHNLNFYRLVQNLRRDNFTLSSGYTKEGGRKNSIIINAKFKSLDEIRNLRIGVKDLRLKDVATVEFKVPEVDSVYHIDRKDGVWMNVFKESGGNTVDVCAGVNRELEDVFSNKYLEGYKYFIIWDQGKAIKNSLMDLQMAGLFGGLFAIIIVFLFLRRIHMTFLVSFSIPLSMFMAILGLYFMGESLNLITLMGLMLAVGMLVDNAIVVSENIERLKNLGYTNLKASVQGAKEVAMAITLATCTTIIVFLPMMLMGSDVGMKLFMRYLGISIILALISSLFVALVLIPYASVKIIKTREIREDTPNFFNKFNNMYGKLLSSAMKRKKEVFIVMLLALISMQFPLNNMKKTGNMNGGPRRVGMRITLPSYLELDEREKYILKIQDILYSIKDQVDMKTVTAWTGRRGSWVNVWLNDKSDDNIEITEALKIIKEAMPEDPGVKFSFRGDHNSSRGGTVNVYFFGKDIDILERIADDAMGRLKYIDGIVNVDLDTDETQKEIVAKVKRDAAIQKDITPLEIESTISYLLRDTMLPKYLTEDREIDVTLRFNDDSKDSLDTVKSMQLASNGKSLPIETLSTFNIQKGVPQIRRQNKNTMLGIKVTYEDKDMREISAMINQNMNSMEFPSGYGWSKGRRFQEMEESDNSTMYAGILAATFVLLLMGVLFESFILPFSIITSVPMAFIGSFWLIWMTGTTFTPFAGTGILILIGIVVNNGIVLIDHINSLRKKGVPKEKAIIQGSRDRSRPILMTAITTIMGLVPLAAGEANLVGIPYAPLAIVVIGGLTTSTLLTLFVVPIIYSLLDSLREFISAYTFSFMKKDNAGDQTVQAEG